MEYDRKMDHPSNGVSMLGCLRPAFADEESYIRRLFSYADGDGYRSEWSGTLSIYLSLVLEMINNSHNLYDLSNIFLFWKKC